MSLPPPPSAPKDTGRQPWLAVVLSLLMPGLGHVYCGHLAAGLLLMLLSGLTVPVAVAAMASSASARMVYVVLALYAIPAIILVAAAHSWHAARRRRTGYEPKDCNRWYVYVLLLLIGTTGSVAYAFYVRAAYFRAFVLPAASMYPTIVPGDRLLASQTAYDRQDPSRGDIVLFPNPDNRRQMYVKRVVAIEGDTIEIRNDEVYLNGEKLRREQAPQSVLVPTRPQITGTAYYEHNGGAKYKILRAGRRRGAETDLPPTKVPAGHCFCLGDNRNCSRDSRHFGPVPLVGIRGRLDCLYFPVGGWSRFGRIDKP
jgi:signal peptidase I